MSNEFVSHMISLRIPTSPVATGGFGGLRPPQIEK